MWDYTRKVCVGHEKEHSRNGCAAVLSLGRPLCSGSVAAMKTAGTGHIKDRRPYIASATRVWQALSESADAQRLAACGGRPDRVGGRCVNAHGVGRR